MTREGAAGDDAAKKAAAIRAFAIDFAGAQASVLSAAGRNLVMTANVRETRPPATSAAPATAAPAAPDAAGAFLPV